VSTSDWWEHSSIAEKTHPGCFTPCSGKLSETESSSSHTRIAPISDQLRDHPGSFNTSTPRATLQVYNVPGLLSPVCNTCLEPYTPTFDCDTPTDWAGSTASPSPSFTPISVLPSSLFAASRRPPTVCTTTNGIIVNHIYPECSYVLQPNTGVDVGAFPESDERFPLGINDQRGDESPLCWDPSTITRYRFRHFERPSHYHTACVGGTPHSPAAKIRSLSISIALTFDTWTFVCVCLLAIVHLYVFPRHPSDAQPLPPPYEDPPPEDQQDYSWVGWGDIDEEEDEGWGNGHNWDAHDWGNDWNLNGWNNTEPAATWGTPPPTPPATPPPPPEPSIAAGELVEEEVTTLAL
jgi:hypothetical protein